MVKYRLYGLLSAVMLSVVLITAVEQLHAEEIDPLETEISSVEERRIIVKLREQRAANEQQAIALRKEKNELNLLRLEVDKKLEQLQLTRKIIEKLLVEKDAREQAKVQELSQMYNKMDPVIAAKIISELDHDLAIGILGSMKAKSAGKVLANIGGKDAADLSTAYSTLKED